jgi:Flp pilus assembly protein TadG
MIGLVGAAVDYSRAANSRSAMQAAADSAALMVAKDLSNGNLTADQITTKAQTYFAALYNRPDTTGIKVSATYTVDPVAGTTILVTGSGSVPTDFMKIAGYPTVPISTTSTATWGSTKLRVALVLDNTGSMTDSNKIGALKTAANSLIDQLKATATNTGDVYISIVPFAKDVNIGASNYVNLAGYLDFDPAKNTVRNSYDGWDDNNGSCSKSSFFGSYSTNSSCTNAGGKWTVTNHTNWNGCVMDRKENYDTNISPPSTSNIDTLFPPEQYSTCPAAIMGMSYDWTALKAKINAMSPGGGTNQGIGLVWGWQTLSTTSAFFPAPTEDAKYTYSKAIILLSDGLNTQSRNYGNGSDPSSQVDARQALLCNNVKAAGITVYTVQVNTGGDPTSTVLQNCASSSDKFFMLTKASQVVTAFNTIGTSLSKLRLSK